MLGPTRGTFLLQPGRVGSRNDHPMPAVEPRPLCDRQRPVLLRIRQCLVLRTWDVVRSRYRRDREREADHEDGSQHCGQGLAAADNVSLRGGSALHSGKCRPRIVPSFRPVAIKGSLRPSDSTHAWDEGDLLSAHRLESRQGADGGRTLLGWGESYRQPGERLGLLPT